MRQKSDKTLGFILGWTRDQQQLCESAFRSLDRLAEFMDFCEAEGQNALTLMDIITQASIEAEAQGKRFFINIGS